MEKVNLKIKKFKETINVELRLDHKVNIDVRLDDVIDGINSCEMKRRWNYIALILNDVQWKRKF